MKDIIITTISDNYRWVDIRNWILSLKSTNYSGDILALCYNFNNEHEYIKRLEEMNVIIVKPNNNYMGLHEDKFVWHSGETTKSNAHKLIHNVRLFHLWQYFSETNLDEKYNRVIFTDGRDIYFQSNPSEWLDKNMTHDILVPSEGVLYENEPWNKNSVISNYGKYVYDFILSDKRPSNVGTFACKSSICKDLCITMYLMANNTGVCDQTAFNVLSNTLLKDRCQWVDYNDAWALQIGTIVNNLTDYVEIDNGNVLTKSKELYCLVHQYDRITDLKKMIDSKYNEEKTESDDMLSFIIPYRNRENHLSKLLPRLKEILYGKKYEIIIAEQNDDEKFSLNSLYDVAYKYTSGDIIVFHDVDYYPSDSVSYYTSKDKPFYPVGKLVFLDENDNHRLLNDIPAGYRNFHNTVGDHAGGVFVLPRCVFEKIGGFNPYYRGWGKDDDDTRARVRRNGYEWHRNTDGLFYGLYHEDSKPDDNDDDFIRNHQILGKFEDYLNYGYKDVSADVEVFDAGDNVRWLKINNFSYTNKSLGEVIMKSYKDVYGFFNYEGLYYHQVKDSNDGDTFVEVGSLWGRSIIFMAQCSKDFGKNIKIYSVDYWDYRGVPELMTPGLDPSGLDYDKDGPDCLYNAYLNNLKECGVDDLIKPLRISSEEASKQFEDNSIDFLFIDAGHTYDDVMNDLNCWYKKVKNGKIISGHDYDWDGVRMAVNEFFGANNIKIHNTSWIYEKPAFDIDMDGFNSYKKI